MLLSAQEVAGTLFRLVQRHVLGRQAPLVRLFLHFHRVQYSYLLFFFFINHQLFSKFAASVIYLINISPGYYHY